MLREVLIKLLELANVSQPQPGKWVVELGTCNALDYVGPWGSGQLHNQPLALEFTVVEEATAPSIVDAVVLYRYSTTTPLGEGGIFQSDLEGYVHRLINNCTNNLLTASAFDDLLTISEVTPRLVERSEGYEDYWETELHIHITA
jgi:hypothetical protein